MAKGWKRKSTDDRKAAYQRAMNKGFDWIDSDLPQFKPQDGENSVRILQPLDGDDYSNHPLGLEAWVSYIEGAGQYVSPRAIDKSATDPMETLARELRKIDPALDDMVNPRRVVVMQILDCNNSDDGELKIWAAPGSLVDDILGASKVRRTGEIMAIEDPEHGRVVFFDKTGSGLKTRYVNITVDSQEFAIEEDLAEDMEYLHDCVIIEEDAKLIEICDGVLETMANGGARKSRRGRDDDDETRGRGGRNSRGRNREEESSPEQDTGGEEENEMRHNIEERINSRGRGRAREPEPETGAEEADTPRGRGRGRSRNEDDDPPKSSGKPGFARGRRTEPEQQEEEGHEPPRAGRRRRR